MYHIIENGCGRGIGRLRYAEGASGYISREQEQGGHLLRGLIGHRGPAYNAIRHAIDVGYTFQRPSRTAKRKSALGIGLSRRQLSQRLWNINGTKGAPGRGYINALGRASG